MATFAIFTGLGFLLFLACLAALVWAIRSGQFDDLETPAGRLLGDDPAPPTPMDRPHARP